MCIELFVIFSDDGLNFCGFCGDFPFIIFYCIYLVVLSFLFYQSGQWSVYFFDRFKKPALVFIDFLKGFSCLYLLQFCSDLSYFSTSARFWVFWSCSSSSFNFDDRVSILDLSAFLMWAPIAIYFPLDTALNVSQRFFLCIFLAWLDSYHV